MLQDEASDEAELARLRRGSLGPNHPDVQRIQKAIAEKNRQIDSRMKGIIEGHKITAQTLKAQAENAETKLRELGAAKAGRAAGNAGSDEVRHYRQAEMDAETQYVRDEALLTKLKDLPVEELRQAIPTTFPDTVLTGMMHDEASAEAELARLQNEHGPSDPAVQSAKNVIAERKQQIDARIKGIITGLEIKAKSLKDQVEEAGAKLQELKVIEANETDREVTNAAITRGPGTYTFGFAFPDEASAALAIKQARELYLGKTNHIEDGHSILLFSLQRKMWATGKEDWFDQLQATLSLPSGSTKNPKFVDASLEKWSPAVVTSEKPVPSKILEEAKDLMNQGRYEESLQHYLWYYHHALEYDSGQTGVRLSFALTDWIELGRRYPKAKQAHRWTSATRTQKFLDGEGYFGLFMDLQNLNRYLQNDDGTYTLFKMIEKRDPALASQCYFAMEGALVQKGEYQTCRKYMGDPEMRFEMLKRSYESANAWQDQMISLREQSKQRMIEYNRQKGLTNAPIYNPPDTSAVLRKSARDSFVVGVRIFIEVLVATGDKAAAEKLRVRALAVLPDEQRLQSAVKDAEIKTGK